VKVHIGELYYGQMEKDSTLVPVTTKIFETIRDADPKDWRPYWFLAESPRAGRTTPLR